MFNSSSKASVAAAYSVRIKGWTKCIGEPGFFEFSHRSRNVLPAVKVHRLLNIRFTYVEARGTFSSSTAIVQRPHDGRSIRFALSDWVSPLIKHFRRGRSQKVVTLFVEIGATPGPLVFELRTGDEMTELLEVQLVDEFPGSWHPSPDTVAQKIDRIIWNAKQRINHKDSSSLLNDLKASLNVTDYEVVERDVIDAISPLLITAHGYSSGLENLDQNRLIEEVSLIMAKANALGCSTFINSGTLLGFVREGRLIAHDDDLDLGVLLPGADEAEVSRSWIRVVNQLAEHFEIARKSNEIATIYVEGGVEVDLFPAWVSGGLLYVYPYCHGALSAEALLPIRLIPWYGCDVGVPQDPDSMLSVNYGAGWRVPDKMWRFDWKQAHVVFESFAKLNKRQLVDRSDV